MIWNDPFSFFFLGFHFGLSLNLIWFEMFSIINTIITATITLPNWLWYTEKNVRVSVESIPFSRFIHSVNESWIFLCHFYSWWWWSSSSSSSFLCFSCAYSCCFFISMRYFSQFELGWIFLFDFDWLTNSTDSTELTLLT